MGLIGSFQERGREERGRRKNAFVIDSDFMTCWNCFKSKFRKAILLAGISIEGDDEILAQMEVNLPPKRDEWMTTLPPERKARSYNPGMAMRSTTFHKSSEEGRGDTSAWTDTPSDRAQNVFSCDVGTLCVSNFFVYIALLVTLLQKDYLETYNEATTLASNDEENKRSNADAELVEKYNKAKRSKSLVQKHQDEGKHPWKPWDHNMAQGLSSRFSAGLFQRNFL
ncbi:hypothetical protein K2173_021902 [Erythroxylum novogranatense]|uniref:DUF3752 domain-containing protein n=1 Tax=Erythroxylum novogranatense TaxID=1862640 RepID=A0AAV8T3B8_9ROSI|nr:hypothetical protein K2173_021902 [Erythroxylum novogranatense]